MAVSNSKPKTKTTMKNNVTINGIRFLKHGVKDSAGNYFPALVYRSPASPITNLESITVYARTYDRGLPVELNPSNDTDSSTDYFEKDSVTYLQGTPEFNLLATIAR